MRHRTFVLLIVGLALVAAAFPCVSSAFAAEVAVSWRPDDEQSTIRGRADALGAGFVRAVHADALALLPGELSEERSALLRERLAVTARDYVQSYSELGFEESEDGEGRLKTLRLDVTVNRPALKKELKRLGVFYTVRGTRPFELRLSGDASGAWAELGRLQSLTGVYARTGAEPLVSLVFGEDGLWSGTISSADESWTEVDKELDALWIRLWAHHFTRPGADAGMLTSLTLTVRGWYAADGVKGFDAELSTWEKARESAELVRVDMLPDGIAAMWKVTTLDRDALVARLDAYLPSRGLSYSFEALP
ncbi:hypothetical protein GGQ74_000279 [Desulfobaculum xiamenense]|uniref:Lipoprotein n=1 Tax=Desulfobaculum xiamenense TaxID=995050 RepID=A0A846QPK6_9BACT|nr:hypothetical protein [Desulfobaculum xiamenense]NJB66639.1 hypothetical protein [Desulfobaculum xiamenense]